MPFDNPYFPQIFDVGTPGAGHIHFANDGSMTLFGPDGVTVLASLTPAAGLRIFKGDISGVTADFGNIAAGHIHFANDGSMTLFGADGVTVEAKLDGTGFTVTGAAGSFIDLQPSIVGGATIQFSTGDVAELGHGQTFFAVVGAGTSRTAEGVFISPGLYTGGAGPYQAFVQVSSSSPDHIVPAKVILEAGLNLDVVWDGSTFNIPANLSVFGQALVGNASGTLFLVDDTSVLHGELHWDGNVLSAPTTNTLNLGNGASSIGGSVNIRNPAAAPLTQHTLTLETVGSQTGDIFRIVNSTNSAVLFDVSAAARLLIANTNVFAVSNFATYGISINPAGASGLSLASDVNGGYIQTFGGQNLRLNQGGNPTQWGNATGVGILNANGSISLANPGATATGGAIFSGSGAPATGFGAIGDVYHRTDTPTTANQRIYIKTAAAVWTGIL